MFHVFGEQILPTRTDHVNGMVELLGTILSSILRDRREARQACLLKSGYTRNRARGSRNCTYETAENDCPDSLTLPACSPHWPVLHHASKPRTASWGGLCRLRHICIW